MHSKVPPSNTYHRNPGLSSHKEDEHIVRQSFNEAEKHIPLNSYRCIPKQSPREADELIQKQFFCKADQCPNKNLKVHHNTHPSSLVPTVQAVCKAKLDKKAPKARDRVCKFWASGNCVKDDCHGCLMIQRNVESKRENGVLSLFGVHDGDVNPVLFCACNDKSVRLYNLPNFTERGRLFSEQELRTIGLGPGGLFFSGDAAGSLGVYGSGRPKQTPKKKKQLQ